MVGLGEKSNRNIVPTAAQLEVQNRASLDSCHPAPCSGFSFFLSADDISSLAIQDQRQATALLLKEAVEWNKSSGVEGAGMATVWRKTAEFHLKTGEAKVAAESLEELQRLEPSLTTLAQLVTAYAKCDLGQETYLWVISKSRGNI